MMTADNGKTARSEHRQRADLGSATSTMIVGSVFIVIVGVVVLGGSLFRRHPLVMMVITMVLGVAALAYGAAR
jgi:hypothetical protein